MSADIAEARRLAALLDLDIIGSPRESVYDDVAKLAAQLFEAPIALISLVEKDRQWFKSCIGLDVSETSREVSFCSHAIAQQDLTAVYVVPDATRDPLFCNNPLVTGSPHIRMYAGAPLVARNGQPIGTLCVIDSVPRQPTEQQLKALSVLARSVIAQIELRNSADVLRDSEELNRLIVETALDAVVTVDAERRVLSWSPQASKLFGVSSLEAAEKSLESLILPSNLSEAETASFCALFRTGTDAHTVQHFELPLVHRNGSRFPAELSVSPLQTRNGWMFSLFARDISTRKNQEIERRDAETRDVVIYALARLAESRDPETGAHIERVQHYCRALAEQLALMGEHKALVDPEFIRLMYTTSPLHDIGKVGIPDEVLLKPGRLNDREFEIMKTHAQIGADTLAAAIARFPNTRFLLMAHNIAATHHEHFDGAGYPRGLKGTDIPLCGRIVALADVYDALTSRRVYKAAFAAEVARGIILKESGKQFDPAIVDAFIRIEPVFEAIRRRYVESEAATAA